ncbi:hypothetical protein [Streptomyces sp. NPDC055060]
MTVLIPVVGLGVRALKWAFPEAADTLDAVHGAYRGWRAGALAAQLTSEDDGAGEDTDGGE